MARPLGRHQITVLSALARHNGGVWSARCPWRLRSATYTARVLESLVLRGYVTRTSATARYAITEDGLNALGWYTCGTCTRLTRSPVIEELPTSRRRVWCSWCRTPDDAGADPASVPRPRVPRAEQVPA